MSTPKRNIGENALQKIVRLLGKLNAELCEEGSGQNIDLVLEATGSGALMLEKGTFPPYPLWTFEALEELANFLEGSKLSQMLAIRMGER